VNALTRTAGTGFSDEDLSFDGPVSVRPTSIIESLVSIEEDQEPGVEDDLTVVLGVEDFEDEAPTQPGAPPAEYRDWRPEDTKVVAYTNNAAMYPKDRPCVSGEAARREVQAIHGRILETNTVPHRWFFRVNKVRSTL
jgi:hypothetical protein